MSSLKNRIGRSIFVKRVLLVVAVVAALAVIQTIPVFVNKPFDAKEYANRDVVVYYEPGDEVGAKEVADLVKNNIGALKSKLKWEAREPLQIYVYKTQFSLFIREAGFITLLVAPSWFIGDSAGGVIRMVSPNTPVPGHTHDSILNATLHEVVHSINFYKNPKLSYFWDNGLATYLAQQKPSKASFSATTIPSFEDLKTDNGLKFGNMGGYAYSYAYVEFLDKSYGWDKVLEYASGGKTYPEVFGKSEQEIYNAWAAFLKQLS